MKAMKELLTAEEIKRIKEICYMFNASVVVIDGVRYKAPRREK